jgi:hypothetical protein
MPMLKMNSDKQGLPRLQCKLAIGVIADIRVDQWKTD